MNIFMKRKQKGFVLATSMIFLIIMTILAVTAIKRSTLDEKIAGNLRSQNLAFQAAERALRFCEASLFLDTGNVDICESRENAIPVHGHGMLEREFPSRWKADANWADPTKVATVNGPNQIPGVIEQPKCMIEEWRPKAPAPQALKQNVKPWSLLITARGVGNVRTAVAQTQEIIRCGNY